MKDAFLNSTIIFVLFSTFTYWAAPALSKMPAVEIGKNKVKVEVAESRAQIERGLMFRTSLPEDHGMVFIFHPARNVRFWMHNCFISLDMLFINEGKIVKISHDVPPCRAPKPEDCPLYPVEGEIEASEVLEVNAGYCERHGIKEGDTIKFELPDQGRLMQKEAVAPDK